LFSRKRISLHPPCRRVWTSTTIFRLAAVRSGVLHRPQVGEELLIPAGAVHPARNVGKTTARWLYEYKRR
jgi:hypothetical protein